MLSFNFVADNLATDQTVKRECHEVMMALLMAAVLALLAPMANAENVGWKKYFVENPEGGNLSTIKSYMKFTIHGCFLHPQFDQSTVFPP